MLATIAAAFVCGILANTPPNAPTITEPAFDGRIVNPEDVHMESAPFSDPDPGDTHLSSDWEISTVSPPEVVWAAHGVTGVLKVHIHLGDGVFQGSYTGRHTLLPSTNYMLRCRHEDSSGDPLTEWSPYSTRLFSSGALSSVFPLVLDDVADSPAPALQDTTGAPVLLPSGAAPASIHAESGASETLLVITGAPAQNQVTNPAPLAAHVNLRIRIVSGGQPLVLAESNLAFADHTGVAHTVFLPAINLASNQSLYYWVAANGGTYVGQASQASPDFTTLARGNAVPWAVQPGFQVEIVAGGFQLPVNIAFVPNPGPAPDAPFFYVTELYGSIKVVHNDHSITDYATNLLNFQPDGEFPGSGEQGLAGLAIDPANGDLIVGMLYDGAPPNGPHFPKVVRLHSADGGRTMATQTTVLDMAGEEQGPSHFISNVSFGPDGKLYVHMGDGFFTATAQDLDSFRGKVLRMNPDGAAPADNPFYSAANGINARDYVFAYGLRNPFGGAWRAADGKHYEVENGPTTDRFAKINAGQNYLWDGIDASMQNFALYNWTPSCAPVNIAFVQSSTFGGSQFPASKLGHAFVAESGPTFGSGPEVLGKRISEFQFDPSGAVVGGPTALVDYNGSGHATCVGLAAGPDGLYFSDLYKDDATFDNPTERGANILRIRFVGAADFSVDATMGPAPLTAHFTDRSTVASPTSWLWTFGDGATSTAQSPTHAYAAPGVYSVRLSTTGAGGEAVLQRDACIRVGQSPKVALIVGSLPPGAADQAVANRLAADGFAVQPMDDEPANRPSAQTLAATYDLVVISSTVDPDSIGGEFRAAGVPLMFWETGLLRLGSESLTDDGRSFTSLDTINIVNNSHPITAGLSTGNLQVYGVPATMSLALGNLGPGAQVLAVRSNTSDPAIMVADQGAVILRDYAAPARRTFFFLEDTSYLAATNTAKHLFDRAACWTGRFDPAISVQPAPLTVTSGQPAVLSVGPTGGAPFFYQWRRNGVALANGGRISGATSRTLTISSTTIPDAGAYDVVVSNHCNTVTSTGATLTVGCYPNCDQSTSPPILNIFDFLCFINKFVAGDPYANCDQSTIPPVLNISDFTCFLNSFSAGCP